MNLIKEKSYDFLVKECMHTRTVDKVESLYNRCNVELTAKMYMAELTEKTKAHEVLNDWHNKYLDSESFIR